MSVLTRRGAISSSLIAQAAPVTFGTPVAQALDSSGGDTLAFAMSGVVSGQPIVIFWMPFQYQATDVVSVTDTFGTSYTWTTVDNNTNADGYGIVSMIGTGGVGTSGTITVTTAHSNDGPGGVAIPAIGASTASGLAAIDTHNVGTNAASTTVDSISLTPAAHHEGAIYAAAQSAYATPAITASPGSPWSDTGVTGNGATFMDVATYSSPAIGTALTTLWGLNSSEPSVVAGIVLKAGTGGGGGGGTPAMPQTIVYDLDGDYTWTAPPGVDDVTVNSTLFAVTPGTVYDIVVGGTCSFNSTDVSGSTVSLTYTYNPGIVGGVSLGEWESVLSGMSSTALAAACQQMKSVGVTYVRFDCDYVSGTVTNSLDNAISAVQAAGMIPVIILEDTEEWNSGYGQGYFGSAWATFCGNAATHYKSLLGDGVIFELSNEVNQAYAWISGTIDCATYAAGAVLAYDAIKAVDSTTTVLMSGLAAGAAVTGSHANTTSNMSALDFITGCYAYLGGTGPWDALNIHPYEYSNWGDGNVNGGLPLEANTTWNMFDNMTSMYSIMQANGDGAKKIWGTEYGLPVGQTNAQGKVMTADMQATELAMAFQFWASLSYTGPFLVFNWFDSSDGPWGLYSSSSPYTSGTARSVLAIFEAGTVVTGGGEGTLLPVVPGSLTGVPTTIVFDDEFDTGTLNETVWDNTYAGTASVLNGTTTVASNVTVDSGGAELTFVSTSSGACITTNPAPKEAGWPGATATGFRVTPPASGGSVYVEWKMNLPSSGGDIANWPACWMSGDPLYPSSNWPTTGEIDIMEGLNYGECGFSLHWGSTVGTDEGETVGYDTAITGGEHTFGVLWTTTGLTFVYDGVVQGTHTFGAGTETTVMTTNPMYLVAQNVGRQNTAPDVSGAIVSVRYCRVWQNSTAPSTPVVAAIPNQSATVGDALSPAIQPSATGGVLPYSWVVSGLPTGLTYSMTTGQITGTPTTVQDPEVTVTVTDHDGNHAETSFSFNIVAGGGGGSFLPYGVPATLDGVTTPTTLVWHDEFPGPNLDFTKWAPGWYFDGNAGGGAFGPGNTIRGSQIEMVSGGVQLTAIGSNGDATIGVITTQNGNGIGDGPWTANEPEGTTTSGSGNGFEGFIIGPDAGPVYVEFAVTLQPDGAWDDWCQSWLVVNAGTSIDSSTYLDEIDVMETGGGIGAYTFWYNGYAVDSDDPVGSGQAGNHVQAAGMVQITSSHKSLAQDEQHIVGCLWTENWVAIYYDGELQSQTPWSFAPGIASATSPMGIVCAMANNGGTTFPAYGTWRYVRVWQGN